MSNGWFNESMRHREARVFGKASGGKIKAPRGVKSSSGKNKNNNKEVSFSEYMKGLSKEEKEEVYNYSEADEVADAKKKPSVIDIAEKDITVGEAVAYHNAEAKKALKENRTMAYRYHTREAIKLNQKARLYAMRKNYL